MSVIDQAWGILKKVAPFQELEEFKQKLKSGFQEYEHLSPDEARAKKAEIKTKMLEQIKSDKQAFGEALAEGAEYILKEKPSTDQEVEVVKLYDEQGEDALIEKLTPEPEQNPQPEGGLKEREKPATQRQQE